VNGGQPIVTLRTYADEEWARTTADPLSVDDDEPWPKSCGICGQAWPGKGHVCATRSRDGLLLALAVIVIVACLGFAAGRAS
jgi:hypothetical protein